MSFEKSLDRINEIVAILEKGEVSLESSLELYKEAVALSADCKKELEQAKLQIKMIGEDDA